MAGSSVMQVGVSCPSVRRAVDRGSQAVKYAVTGTGVGPAVPAACGLMSMS
jgi:hypothetical protein